MHNNGLIFDFHRATTGDGPGLRTTVFFKGCPLHCKWCHNPESINKNNEIIWTKNKCIGCGTCTISCKENAINKTNNGIFVNKSKCLDCGTCINNCPAKALKYVGKYWNINDLISESIKDYPFMKEFDGGVTISGGEPMLQYEFLKEFLTELKKHNINIALDTCGYTKWDNYEKIFPLVDVFLYDIKVYDKEVHKKLTGVSNELILENLCNLANLIRHDNTKKLWIRTPLIPNATANIKNIQDISYYIKDNIFDVMSRWELCAFNNMCRTKYEKLNISWEYTNEPLMQEEVVKNLYEAAKNILKDKVYKTGITT